MEKSIPSSIRLRYETTKNLRRQKSKNKPVMDELVWEATRGYNAPIASDMDASHAVSQNLTIPERELFLSNAWPSSRLGLCTAYATVINMKSDARFKLDHMPLTLVQPIFISLMYPAYQCLQLMVHQHQLFNNNKNNKDQNTKTTMFQCRVRKRMVR